MTFSPLVQFAAGAVLLSCGEFFQLGAAPTSAPRPFSPPSGEFFSRVADAIYRIEGGARTRWPYGIKCHRHTLGVARRMCITTVSNSYASWLVRGQSGDFLHHLADRYCPPSVDPVGNRNWKRNIFSLCPPLSGRVVPAGVLKRSMTYQPKTRPPGHLR